MGWVAGGGGLEVRPGGDWHWFVDVLNGVHSV
jgi:hypothetical protein